MTSTKTTKPFSSFLKSLLNIAGFFIRKTVKPLDYTRLKRYYKHMETRKAQFQHPTKRNNIMTTSAIETSVNQAMLADAQQALNDFQKG
ncbi:hypothetical protein KC218_21900, partial [Mycobacterium tuberculosis]|nr:hypothetical protein [Mycobacterium tuberculosis]